MVQLLFSRWWITRFTQPLSFLVFAGGAWFALDSFPRPFDWRRMMISVLLSPRDNPAGFPWIAFGIALSGLFLLPLGGYLFRVLRRISHHAAGAVRNLIAVGCGCMMMVAAIADLPASPRLHSVLALLAFVSLLSGLMAATVILVRHPEATHLSACRRAWRPLLLASMALPIAAAVVTQAAIALPRAAASAVHGSVLFNIAFWEWVLAGLIYAGGWILAWLSGAGEAAR